MNGRLPYPGPSHSVLCSNQVGQGRPLSMQATCIACMLLLGQVHSGLTHGPALLGQVQILAHQSFCRPCTTATCAGLTLRRPFAGMISSRCDHCAQLHCWLRSWCVHRPSYMSQCTSQPVHILVNCLSDLWPCMQASNGSIQCHGPILTCQGPDPDCNTVRIPIRCRGWCAQCFNLDSAARSSFQCKTSFLHKPFLACR